MSEVLDEHQQPEESPEETPQEPQAWKYAQIDLATGKCIVISYPYCEIIADNMIELDEDSTVQPGDIYKDGVWTPAPPPEPKPSGPTLKDQIATLQQENALLNDQIVSLYELLITQGVI